MVMRAARPQLPIGESIFVLTVMHAFVITVVGAISTGGGGSQVMSAGAQANIWQAEFAFDKSAVSERAKTPTAADVDTLCIDTAKFFMAAAETAGFAGKIWVLHATHKVDFEGGLVVALIAITSLSEAELRVLEARVDTRLPLRPGGGWGDLRPSVSLLPAGVPLVAPATLAAVPLGELLEEMGSGDPAALSTTVTPQPITTVTSHLNTSNVPETQGSTAVPADSDTGAGSPQLETSETEDGKGNNALSNAAKIAIAAGVCALGLLGVAAVWRRVGVHALSNTGASQRTSFTEGDGAELSDAHSTIHQAGPTQSNSVQPATMYIAEPEMHADEAGRRGGVHALAEAITIQSFRRNPEFGVSRDVYAALLQSLPHSVPCTSPPPPSIAADVRGMRGRDRGPVNPSVAQTSCSDTTQSTEA
mmetsp:Transcript_27041/g.81053  ORF Transcript_27041/g.81053 Transcript_27041/m.81053 type:complete len:419 (-) Transcript_27041:648-1904(-)